MDAEEIKKAQEIFDLLDKNNSESLHVQELGKALRGMGLAPSEQHIKDFMEKCEKDPNNCISLEEFRKIFKECKAISSFNNEEVISQLEAEVFIDVPKSLGPATLNLVTQGNEELHILTAAKNVSQTNNKIFSINTTLKS